MPVLSPLESLPEPVLKRVGFHVATQTFLGPPNDLVSLFCTCRIIHNVLSYDNELCAQIFPCKFDSSALRRRFSPRMSMNPSLAHELRLRFSTLKRIRHCQVTETHKGDLWRAYIMLLESDGRNESQLIDWAHLDVWVRCVIAYRMLASHPSCAWFTDAEGTALAAWLLWMTASREKLRNESPGQREVLLKFIQPFVVLGQSVTSFHAPDSHFALPLCNQQNGFAPHASGPSPHVTTITLYNNRVTLSVPLITPAMLLNFAVLIEARQDSRPIHRRISNLPLEREPGLTGLTVEDTHHFHYGTRTRFFARSPLHVQDDDRPPPSEQRDIDWYRLVSCCDPFSGDTPLRGNVYTPGQASGHWDGRILVPSLNDHIAVANNPRTQVNSVPIAHERFRCWFEEHHCITPSEPVRSWDNIDDEGDNILNAWFPRLSRIMYHTDHIEVYDPATDEHVRYETYRAERSTPYSNDICTKLQNQTSEWIPGDIDLKYSVGDDEWEDTVEHLSSGVRDIIITGETTQRQGDAWGHYTYIGRVRPWDGLVVLLRIPKGSAVETHGRWLFRGYFHDQNLVGRWRGTGSAVDSIGLEGGFILCKTDP